MFLCTRLRITRRFPGTQDPRKSEYNSKVSFPFISDGGLPQHNHHHNEVTAVSVANR